MNRWERFLIRTALLVALLFVLASAADLLTNFRDYRFGTEVGGWRMRSLGHYCAFLLLMTFMCGAGLVSHLLTGALFRNERTVAWATLGAIVFVMLYL